MDWTGRRVLVTGGASFIGSHIVDTLIQRGAIVRVVDDLSSGFLGHLEAHIAAENVQFMQGDLRDQGTCRAATAGIETIFHLAADHGGRGYVNTFQAGPAGNLYLDGQLFWEAVKAGVDKVVYASSGCVYPNFIQSDVDEELYLTEDMVGPPYDADNMYGWAKLMAEMTLQAYHREHGLKAASCRFFTVYGPRAKENHAVMAMTARSFIGQNPFLVWGDGTQIRNWTHVDDIVTGMILSAERIDDGTAINLGTMERIRVIEAVNMVLEITGHKAQIQLQPEMPTGPKNRVADNSLAQKLLGWAPDILFADGLRSTIEWYYRTKNRDEVEAILQAGGLISRNVQPATSNE